MINRQSVEACRDYIKKQTKLQILREELAYIQRQYYRGCEPWESKYIEADIKHAEQQIEELAREEKF
jgi:hypothetical protein